MRNTIIVGGKPIPVPGVEIVTWEEGGLRFPAQHFRSHGSTTEITIHETVTETVAEMVKAFQRATLGTHFAADPVTGRVFQYADPAYHVLYHAAGHNKQGVGFDVINPYYPERAKERGDRVVIDVPWADRGRNKIRDYIVPRLAPLESLWRVVMALTSKDAGLAIPWVFPGVKSGAMAMTQTSDGNQRIAGIWAHGQQFSMKDGVKKAHADGFFPLLYVYLRHNGMEAGTAYESAIRLAQQGKYVSV